MPDRVELRPGLGNRHTLPQPALEAEHTRVPRLEHVRTIRVDEAREHAHGEEHDLAHELMQPGE